MQASSSLPAAPADVAAPPGNPSFATRVFQGIIDHRRVVIALFVVAVAIAAALMPLVRVNYDFADYLPPDAASSVAIDTLEEEYDEAAPNARVMIEGVTLSQALDLKERIAQVEGVCDVLWLDDAADVHVPLEVQDQQTVETYYRDGNALFTVTIDDDLRIEAVEGIRALVGETGALTGGAIALTEIATTLLDEIALVTVLAVLLCLLILAITTTSWVEPLVVMAAMGAAVVLNMGSNLIFGEVSFISNAAGAVLQIAISLDYSVFLLHRFHECHGIAPTAAEDMVATMGKAFNSIISSAVTTVVGFLVLGLMQFKMGGDLGLVMAKGIAISLVTTFTLTACLIVACDRPIEATRHRGLTPPLKRFGAFVSYACVPMALLLTVLAVPAYLATNSPSNSYNYSMTNVYAEGSTYGDDTARITKIFGEGDTYVLLVPQGNAGAERALAADLDALPQITSVTSYAHTVGSSVPTGMLPPDQLEQLNSPNYTRLIATVDAKLEGDATFDLVEQVRSIAQEHYPDAYHLTGEGVVSADLKSTLDNDQKVLDLVMAIAVFAILLFATRSLSLPVILVLIIEVCIWVNFSVPYFRDDTLFRLVVIMLGSIQLGMTVDYAILFTDRYLENRRLATPLQAVRATVPVTTVPILTSASVLAGCCFLLGFVSSNTVIAQVGSVLSLGCVCATTGVIFALPGFLVVFDRIVGVTTWKARFYKKPRAAEEQVAVAWPSTDGLPGNTAPEAPTCEPRPKATETPEPTKGADA